MMLLVLLIMMMSTMPSLFMSFEKEWYDERDITFLSKDDFALAQMLQFDQDEAKSTPIDDPESSHTYFEGDMMIKETEEAKVAMYTAKRWPNGRIPYIMENKFSRDERAAIARGIMTLQERTCIRFVPKRAHDKDYVLMRRGPGCAAHVGRIGGQQWLFLGKGCYSIETVVHELMHSVGFIHEQSRPDRDAHVHILWQNIKPAAKRNFRKHTTDYLADHGFPYDLMSVMHYRQFAFSKNKKQTIVARRPVPYLRCRGLECPSDLDVRKINYLYKCSHGKSNYYGNDEPKHISRNKNNQIDNNILFGQPFHNELTFNQDFDDYDDESDQCFGTQCHHNYYPDLDQNPYETQESQLIQLQPIPNYFWSNDEQSESAIW